MGTEDDQESPQKLPGGSSGHRQTAVIHIVISVMYLVDAIILPFTHCSNLESIITLAINTLVALITGIIGIRASTKLASIRIMQVYKIISSFNGITAFSLIIVIIVNIFKSSCDESKTLFSITFATYSIISALVGIFNSVVSVFRFRLRLASFEQKKSIDNSARARGNKKDENFADNVEYSTIKDLGNSAGSFKTSTRSENITATHTYEKKLHRESQSEDDNDSPTNVSRHEEERTYMEVGDTTKPNVYDYTYVPPQPPPRQTNKNQSVNTYLELYDVKKPELRGVTLSNAELYGKLPEECENASR